MSKAERIRARLRERGGSSVVPIDWDGKLLSLLDQRLLPHEERWLHLSSWEEAAKAITDMVVRGAPAIGITAAFGMVLAAKANRERWGEALIERLEEAGKGLSEARPTAVNLSWAVKRMLGRAREGLDDPVGNLETEAVSIWEEDVEANLAMGDAGAALIPDGATILTHCNAGALATGGYGTALGVIRSAYRVKNGISVLADETRPWLQGSRLTAWELLKDGIPVSLVVEGAAGSLMRQGRIQAVVVGADRIAANGDVANKIGTYNLAVLARAHCIPFYVAAPTSTLDPATATGEEIVIEERPEEEVLTLLSSPLAPPGARAVNQVFDITPAHLVTAIVTEKGVLKPPFHRAIESVLQA